MSIAYDEYLKEHTNNVKKGFLWLRNEFPDHFKETDYEKYFSAHNGAYDVCFHDNSKYSDIEYNAYDAYFYGGNRSSNVVKAFNEAWLHHIHHNPHHWQYWVLLEDDPETGEGYVCIEMPKLCVLEMMADWWSFSWSKGDLYEIFNWYEAHKGTIKLHKRTRELVETVLQDLRKRLDELHADEVGTEIEENLSNSKSLEEEKDDGNDAGEDFLW